MNDREILRIIKDNIEKYPGDQDQFIKCNKISSKIKEKYIIKYANLEGFNLFYVGGGYLLEIKID